ncbi:C-C motif chemokine 20 isoform X2 [Centropristis striata]|uniref:C-C motif chemokine 20 isoform X2 n=1 Tax=Centropristis striata TaxID=184440 RepID=UPI0027E152C1|nr:C-C motif chemokine 20 isoform X2 [Centropristis striata]
MTKLIVCVSLTLLLLVALTESSPFCCTEYQEEPVSVKVLKEYKMQDITHYCNIKAAIFKTVKRRFFCANPDKKWVKDAMKAVPEV